MAREDVKEFFERVKQNADLKETLQDAHDAGAFMQIAKEQGYQFTEDELQAELNKLSEQESPQTAEEVAETANPGVGPRRHIQPS